MRTIPAKELERSILDDVIAYFESEYEPSEVGVEPPDADTIPSQWFDFSYLAEVEVVSWRWSMRPYAYTAIVYDPAENEHRYQVETPNLTEFERYVREDLTRPPGRS